MAGNISREEALTAIPVVAAILEQHPLDGGGVRVVVALPTLPIQQKLLRLPPTTRKEYELDIFGKEILDWCDGKRPVSELVRLFAEKHPMHPQESEKALLTFLRTLVAKGLIVLAMPGPAGAC